MNTKHPAKFTDSFIPIFADILKEKNNVIDIFAGTGKIVEIKNLGYKGKVFINEIEPEWAEINSSMVDGFTKLDAENLPYKDEYFEAVCTSPTYGNRMADCHNAKDGSKRNTYTHTLGRKLDDENTGKMQWGDKYREKHKKCWLEAKRILKKEGLLILNMSDHIRKGEIIPVTDFHISFLESIGFTVLEHKKINTPRNGFGANANVRVDYESIIILKKE